MLRAHKTVDCASIRLLLQRGDTYTKHWNRLARTVLWAASCLSPPGLCGIRTGNGRRGALENLPATYSHLLSNFELKDLARDANH